MWEKLSDIIGVGYDALKPTAKLQVFDLSGKLHPKTDSTFKDARWICRQVCD